MALATSAGSVTAERSTHHTPSGKASVTSAATCWASRVLPVPPKPVSVISRFSKTSRATVSMASKRPMKDDSETGRLFGTASSERNGGKSVSMSAWASCHTCSGRDEVLEAVDPEVE